MLIVYTSFKRESIE